MIVQLIKHLLCKHEDVSSIPRIHAMKRNTGAAAHVCNSTTREVDTGRCLGLAGQTA